MLRSNRVLLSAGLFLAAVFIFFTSAFAKQLKTLEDPRSKYTLKYPEDYRVKVLGRVTVFVSPNTDKKTGFSENVNITVESLSDPAIKLDDFFNQAKKNLPLTVKGVSILEEKKDKLSGADAYRIVFTSQQKKEIFKLLQVVSLHKGKAFVVTYTALTEQFDRSLSQANAIIKSLKFTD
jgi:hypothetical protein